MSRTGQNLIALGAKERVATIASAISVVCRRSFKYYTASMRLNLWAWMMRQNQTGRRRTAKRSQFVLILQQEGLRWYQEKTYFTERPDPHPVRFLFQPIYAPWLNLIEPWRKTLRLRALHGLYFRNPAKIVEVSDRVSDYWNSHCHAYVRRKPPNLSSLQDAAPPEMCCAMKLQREATMSRGTMGTRLPPT